MRYMSRLTGETLVFKNKEAYEAHLRDLEKSGVMKEGKPVPKLRPGLLRKARDIERHHTPPFTPAAFTRKEIPRPPSQVRQRFSLVHPSRGRPDQAWECMCRWRAKCSPFNNLEYVLSLDRDDADKYRRTVREMVGTIDLRVVIHDNKTMVEALNVGARVARGDVLIYVSDDFECPDNWDVEIQKCVGKEKDWVLFVYDGIQKSAQTISILSRVYFERFGYIYYPEYMSLWADPDFTETAIRLGKNIDGMHLLFRHNHYSTGRSAYDPTYAKQDSEAAWKHGESLFQRRAKGNFGVKK